MKKLEEIIHIKHGFAFKGEFFTDEPSNNILVTPGNFYIGGGFKTDKLKYYTGPIPKDYILNQGDVIITMTDLSKQADTLGFSAKVPDNKQISFLHNQRIGLVKIIDDRYDINYIYWILRTHDYQRYIAGSATGATVKHTSPSKIGSYNFNPHNNINTQRRIASILSSYDDLIENNLKRIKLLEEIAQRTYEEWFVKFRVNGEQLTIDEKIGLPLGWSVIEFQDIGQIVTGKTPSTKNQLFFNGEIPFVKTPDMSGFPYVLETSQYLSELGANSQKNKYIPKNSLMVSCIGSAGVIALASQSCQTNQQINTIVFQEPIYTFYFYCFAKGLKPVLEALGSNGATMTNVNKGKFEKMKIVCPNYETLEKFNSLSNPIFELILDLQKQNQKLKESRDILLPKLMNGTINVE